MFYVYCIPHTLREYEQFAHYTSYIIFIVHVDRGGLARGAIHQVAPRAPIRIYDSSPRLPRSGTF